MNEQEKVVINNIQKLLKEQKKQKKDLCSFIGVSHTNFGNWVAERNTSFMKYLYQIADYFNVSVDYLLGKTDEKKPATNKDSEQDAEFNELFQQLSKEQQAIIISSIKGILSDK